MSVTIREEVEARFDNDEIREIVDHGANAGWPGFTYYRDTNAFAARHESQIWDWLWEDAQGMGESILQYVASLPSAKDVGSPTQFRNLLAWYALERVCTEIVNERT